MSSLLDKMRSEPRRAAIPVVMGAADPDVEVMGFACVCANVGGDAPLKIAKVSLACVSFRYLKCTGLEQSSKVVRALFDGASPFTGCTHVAIESQQFYPNPDMPRNKMVSVAESLLRIAQVTGALQVLALDVTKLVHVCLPAEWKQQRKKEVDHKESLRICGSAPVDCYAVTGGVGQVEPTPDFAEAPGKWEHALDALGIALYGLELLHTQRWPS